MLELFKLAGIVTIEGIQGATSQLNTFEKSTIKAIRPIVKFGREAKKAGINLSKYLTLPLAGAATAAIKFAGDFDKALTTSTAIMSDVSSEMRKQLSDTARQLSKESTFSAKELAEAYYYLASAGLSVEQSLSAIAPVSKFAEAGQFDLKVATDLLTDAQSALGLTVADAVENEKNMVRVSDALVKGATLANATVQQFSEALTNKAAQALRLLGKDVEEGVAVLAAYADQGVKGAAAGEQMYIALRDLQRAISKDSEVFKKYNIAVYDANGEMRLTHDIIKDLEEALLNKSDMQKRAIIEELGFQDRSIQSLLTLIGTSEKMGEVYSKVNGAIGTTAETAEKQILNFNDQLKLLYHRIQDVGIELGNNLIPIIKNDLFPIAIKLIENTTEIVKSFSEWNGTVRKLTLAIPAFVALLGPISIAIGQIATGTGLAASALVGIKTVVAGLATIFSAVNVSIGLVAASIAFLVVKYREMTAEKRLSNQIAETHTKLMNAEGKEADKLREKYNKQVEALHNLNQEKEILTARNKLLEKLYQSEEYLNATREERIRLINEEVDKLDMLYKSGETSQQGMQQAAQQYGHLADRQSEHIINTEDETDSLEKQVKALSMDIMNLEAQNDELDEGTKLYKKKMKEQREFEKFQKDLTDKEKKELEIMKKASIKWDEERLKLSKEIAAYDEDQTWEKIKAVKNEMKEKLDAAEKYGLDRTAIEDHYRNKISKIIENANKKDSDNEDKNTIRKKKNLEKIHDLTIDTAERFVNVFQTAYNNESIMIDNNYKKRKATIENSQKSEEAKEKALEDLDKEYDAKKSKLMKKQMIAQKAMSLFNIYTSTREAITKALTVGPILGPIFAGLIGALGAIQAALVVAQPIPEMAEGGIIGKSQGGSLVRAGEAGQDEGFIPMKTGTASIADAIINSMRRFPLTGQPENVGRFSTGSTVALNVGTLVADDRGLTELERRLKVFRVADNNRLGIV